MSRLARLRERLIAFIHSIRFRLVLWYTLILAFVLIAFSAFVYASQVRDQTADSLGDMERRSVRIEELMQVELSKATSQNAGTSAGVQIPDTLLQENDVLVLIGPGGSVIGSRGPIPAEDAIHLAEHALEGPPLRGEHTVVSAGWAAQGKNSTRYLFLVAPIVEGGKLSGFMVFGSPLDPAGELPRLLLTLLAGSLVTLAIALIGGIWLADRAMRPVRTITQTARTLSETDLSRRLNMGGRDELGELANTLDAMLARLDTAFTRQRQFVADASHELRTPLTIVNLEASRALAAQRKPQEYERALEVIRTENDFMSRLVNDLLLLAHMDAGQTPIQKSGLDLSDVALEAVERLTKLASRKSVRLETGDLPEAPVLGDRQYLLQMINNLIENGIKYTTGEDKVVRVETGADADRIWLRVSDSGPGIPAEHLPHLFDRFYQVDKARTRNGVTDLDPPEASGSGLGLSIVQWIVQAHGGEVHVESGHGAGTTFEVSLPRGDVT
jgi:heavy metal sensor kinase